VTTDYDLAATNSSLVWFSTVLHRNCHEHVGGFEFCRGQRGGLESYGNEIDGVSLNAVPNRGPCSSSSPACLAYWPTVGEGGLCSGTAAGSVRASVVRGVVALRARPDARRRALPDETTQRRKIPLVFYRTAAGSEPVREWLKRLDEAERHAIGKDLLRAQSRCPATWRRNGRPACCSASTASIRSRWKAPEGVDEQEAYGFQRG